MWTWFHKLASPPHAYRLLGRFAPWFGWPALALILLATWWGLYKAPMDYQQKDAFRILYVHAPSAWMSMFAYVLLAVAAAVGLVWRIKLAHAAAAAAAPVGRMNQQVRNSNPLKLREYLATGKPIVSVPTPEVERFGELLNVAEDREGFLAAIELALNDDTDHRSESRIQAVRDMSWEHRAQSSLEIALAAMTKRAHLREVHARTAQSTRTSRSR